MSRKRSIYEGCYVPENALEEKDYLPLHRNHNKKAYKIYSLLFANLGLTKK